MVMEKKVVVVYNAMLMQPGCLGFSFFFWVSCFFRFLFFRFLGQSTGSEGNNAAPALACVLGSVLVLLCGSRGGVGGCNYIPRPGIILASSFGYKAKCASIYSIDVAEVDPWERPGGGAVFTQNTSYQHQQHKARTENRTIGRD